MTDQMSVRVAPASVDEPAVRSLILFHLADMKANSPPELAFVLDVDAYRDPALLLLGAWVSDDLAAIGAMRDLGDGTFELKSMRAAPEFKGRGAGKAILRQLMEEARTRDAYALLLETGTGERYVAAEGLYRAHGFVPCPAFGDYPADSPFNRYFRFDFAA
jgi:putative acetyltransferase